MTHPLGAAAAWSFVQNWFDADNAWIATPGPRHGVILQQLLVVSDLRGSLVSDAHLAALAI